ncbi:hypothetical protein TNIN_208341 [Trichonephila inaurata madagascariensis]|uniref:Tc1-like transposase DDE domain-containing protein n=1 Tax=Trichonephila inaurata madagascariensis TaxID=2747483 RepID=A0A8X6YQP3_9ARAC|nr:hypothetical protein TNIN_208341 [Trichonephila inaurata madagascariensis]
MVLSCNILCTFLDETLKSHSGTDAGVVLFVDNSRLHTAQRIKRLLQEFPWKVFTHPACVPSLAFNNSAPISLIHYSPVNTHFPTDEYL